MSDNLQIRPVTDGDVATVIALWKKCDLVKPWNDPNKDIAFARSKPESDVLVGEHEGKIVASLMVGHDGHRGIVYYVSVSPDCQGKGFGHAIMRAAEEWLRERDVWKLNLLIREGNEQVQAFYESLGYEVEPRMSMARKLMD